MEYMVYNDEGMIRFILHFSEEREREREKEGEKGKKLLILEMKICISPETIPG